MNLPENIFISGQYTWIRPEGDYVVIGLNEYILYENEEICSVELPEVGTDVEVEGHFITAETNRGLLEIYSPVSGQIVEVNEEIYDEPELINFDPYGSGWLVVVEVEDYSVIEDVISDQRSKRD